MRFPEHGTSKSPWIDSLDILVADEIAGIECENLSYAMRFHRRHKIGIVHFRPDHLVCGHQLPPSSVSQCRIRQDLEIPFEKPGMEFSAGDANPESVVIGR